MPIMAMGLNIAARVFTKVVLEVLKLACMQGIHVQLYLDDWLVKGWDPKVVSQ